MRHQFIYEAAKAPDSGVLSCDYYTIKTINIVREKQQSIQVCFTVCTAVLGDVLYRIHNILFA